MRYERLKISKPIVKAVLASEKHVFWASQTSFKLQSTAKSSAMVPRMIWDHVVFGPKIDQKPGVLAKTLGGAFQIAQHWVLGTQNTQKHSKTLKNTQKTPNMPGTFLVTQDDTRITFKTHCKSCFGVRKTRFLSFTDVIHAPSTTKSLAMVPRMIWDYVVFGKH